MLNPTAAPARTQGEGPNQPSPGCSPAGTRARANSKGIGRQLSGEKLKLQCCQKAGAFGRKGRPVWKTQIKKFLKDAYPKWSDPDMQARIDAAVELLDSIEVFTFADICTFGLDEFMAVELPLGLRNVLLNGLDLWLEERTSDILPPTQWKRQQSALLKYGEFKSLLNYADSTFNPWDFRDGARAGRLTGRFTRLADTYNRLDEVFDLAIQLVKEGKDGYLVDWALGTFINRHKIPKLLRIPVLTPEDMMQPDHTMSSAYLDSISGSRGLGDTDWLKVSPLTFDSLYAAHHLVWHQKYSTQVDTEREGEYFMYMHSQILALFKIWAHVFGVTQPESTKTLTEMPAFRASDQFHKHGDYGEAMIPFRIAGCPIAGSTYYISGKTQDLLTKGALIKDGGLHRYPTKAEIDKFPDEKKNLYLMAKDSSMKPLQDYRDAINQCIKNDWKFPMIYFGSVHKGKDETGDLSIKDVKEPPWKMLSLFGSFISEVWVNPSLKPDTTKDVVLPEYHAYLHSFSGRSMLPEPLNIKDPFFYCWHTELDDYRIQCVKAFPEREDLAKPRIGLGKVEKTKLKITDVILKEHKECTPLADFKNKIKRNKEDFALKIGEPDAVPHIDEWDDKKKAWQQTPTGDAELTHMILTGMKKFQTGFEPAKAGFIPFSFNIRVALASKTKKGFEMAVRIFICPEDKIDADDNRWWFELDKFTHMMPPNSDHCVIVRSIMESSVCMKKSIFLTDETSKFGAGAYKNCDCGLPWNLLLPPGSPDGTKYKLFVMITDAANDVVEGMKLASSSFSLTMCWGQGKGCPDLQVMGYPFAAIPTQAPSAMVDVKRPHIFMRDVVIKRHDIVEDGVNVETALIKDHKQIYKKPAAFANYHSSGTPKLFEYETNKSETEIKTEHGQLFNQRRYKAVANFLAENKKDAPVGLKEKLKESGLDEKGNYLKTKSGCTIC